MLNAVRGDSLVEQRRADAEAMAEIDEELATVGIPQIVEHRSGRDPVDEILDKASQPDVDLVVIAMRRRSPVGKLLPGSAAQRILLEGRLLGPRRQSGRMNSTRLATKSVLQSFAFRSSRCP